MATKRYLYANGKRKTAVARVRMFDKGEGNIIVNEKPIKEYFSGVYIANVLSPLTLTDNKKRFDITILVKGGGYSSQADACRHAISKALVELDAEYRLSLKQAGFITRDSRVKERKKPGLKRARRAPQWAKR